MIGILSSIQYYDSENTDIIRLSGNNISNFYFFLAFRNPQQTGPTEEDPLITFSLFEESIYGNKLRYYFEITFYELEELTYQIYKLLEDIPDLDQNIRNSILNFIYSYESNLPQ